MIGGFFNKPVGRQYVAAFVGKYMYTGPVEDRPGRFRDRVREPVTGLRIYIMIMIRPRHSVAPQRRGRKFTLPVI